MITRLYIDQMFKHFDQTFTFEKGLTGIVGPNESGKSLITEAIRYALFGSKALRGKSEDYRKLHVELDFVINDVEYTVLRKGSKATLTGGREASGTRPVDEAIQSLLGYGLTVFDVANACNQGNVEALSDMTPANRKLMVDQTVGLDSLDDLIRFAGSEANTLKREAEAMRNTLVEPIKPEGEHRCVDAIRKDLELHESIHDERIELETFISRAPRKPEAPEDCGISETAEELSTLVDSRSAVERGLKNLNRQLAEIEPETIAEDELATIEQHYDLHQLWLQKQRLLAKGYHECPECKHQWPIADLGELVDIIEVDAPSLTKRDIDLHRARLGNNKKIAALQQAINEHEEMLVDLPDRSADLEARLSYEAQLSVYEKQISAWNAYNDGLAEKIARLEELPETQVSELREELSSAEQFNIDLQRYIKLHDRYIKLDQDIEALEARSNDLYEARKIIQALKVSVKTHLLPSLNKVASILLSQMTGGERYLVEVDEDFEITIDGQRLNTLSGSGKAVANLAIRIALGQILTNRVFSVFMADEVDAAMDDERAAYTADALRRLTDTVGQVVLVTHKNPETDKTIELKK